MTVKCLFCKDTKIEPGFTGPCVWCEDLAAIAPKYEDVVAQRDAALGRETALREERATLRESYESMRDRKNSIVDLQKRLTVAEQRAVKFEELLLQTNEMLYQIQGDPGAVPSSSIDAMRGEVFTALKPAAEAHKCIECESQYCHGVCVERGDDYERYKGAEGEGS